jgi:formylglycine-generating enzyme required for sulfatase activity
MADARREAYLAKTFPRQPLHGLVSADTITKLKNPTHENHVMSFTAASYRQRLIRLSGILLAGCLCSAAHAVTIDMVTVGNPGNAGDTTGYGAVAYEYRMGKYEVTIGQYTAFLNAVAQTDTYSLYNANMETNLNVAGIARTGSPGAYTYSVINNGGDSSNRPITYVSWFDAARFSNWMSNGQPAGSQGAATTENGAYNVNGATSGNAVAKNVTNPNTGAAPSFFIPLENEWYKAAYYSPTLNSGSGGYYSYATQSDSQPGNIVSNGSNQVNYTDGNGYSVTQSYGYDANQNYLTDVGAFSGSGSVYGTFDQSGNVTEWNDLNGNAGSLRGRRGGNWDEGGSVAVSSAGFGTYSPSSEYSRLGFRLASPASSPSGVPEIDPAGMGSVLALVTGALGLLERRRLKAS